MSVFVQEMHTANTCSGFFISGSHECVCPRNAYSKHMQWFFLCKGHMSVFVQEMHTANTCSGFIYVRVT